MATAEDLIEFASGYGLRHGWFRRTDACQPDGDLFGAIGTAGDDGDDFLRAYAERFDVSLDGFLADFL